MMEVLRRAEQRVDPVAESPQRRKLGDVFQLLTQVVAR
jgi:hypothetical protein